MRPRNVAGSLLIILSARASAQTDSVVMSGKVLSTGGRTLRGADISVSVKDPDHPAARFTRTGADGSYRVAVARSTFGYLVTARMTGYKLAFVNVPSPATDSRLVVPELRLEPTTQELPTVSVIAERRPASREIGSIASTPGMKYSIFDSRSAEGGDTGDPMTALSGVAGLTVTSDGSGALSYSFAGLGNEQNRIMMNGAEFAGTPPREGFALKVATNSYDPAVASSGGSVEYMFSEGGRTTLHLTLDSPALQYTTPLGDRLGRRQSSPIVSGLFSGSRSEASAQESGGRWWPTRFTTSYEVRRTSRALSTLSNAGADALAEFRIAADSTQRLLAVLPALGIGAPAPGGAEQVTTAVTSYTRLDFTSNSGSGCFSLLSEARPLCSWGLGETRRMTYLVVGGTWRDSRGIGVGPTSLPTAAIEARAEDGHVQLVNSMYLGGTTVANDTRSTIGFSRNRVAPASSLPAASVLLTSGDLRDPYYASVDVAGGGGSAADSRNWTWQTKNETNWFTLSGKHELKVAVEGTVDRFTRSHDASLGRFVFNTLGDFLAGAPTSFTRSLAQPSTTVTGLHTAIGIGDVFSPRTGLSIQYGLRGERHAFDAGGVRNAEVESAFARRTDRIPAVLTISPMVGFTWNYKDFNEHNWPDFTRTFMGGIRDYAGLLPTQGFQPFASETGLSTGARDLYCIGSATPTPAWALYQTSAAAIPDQCADGSTGGFTQRTPSVSVLSPDFRAAHAWRADLQWIGRLSRTINLSFATTGALNIGQRSLVDLNFNGNQRFALPDEAGRPVYVFATSVVPATGALSTVDSRVQPQFARVSEVGSSFRSQSASLTGTLDYHPVLGAITSGFHRPFTLSYTLSDTRGESNGFAGTTDGDPRTSTMSAGLGARHVVILSTMLQRAGIVSVNAFLRVQSGTPYTPRVSGDINGDGLRNDRAFVFDPRATADTDVADGMTRLLASAPASVVRCLSSQVGTIARENSCTGPWTATLNANATLPPELFRLQNRGRVTLKFVNVMAGVDQLLHGADGMRGWGQYSYVDATLLTVRRFDPAKPRFVYSVNPDFGSGRAFRSASLAPFRLILDVTLDLGANLERVAMVRFLTPRAAQGFVPFDSAALFRRFLRQNNGMFDHVLDVKDSIQLTPLQRDSIIAMNLRYSAFRDSAAGGLARYLVAQGSTFDRPEVQERWHRTLNEVMAVQQRNAAALHALLTTVQWQYLRDNTGSFEERPYLKAADDAEIERMSRRWKTYFP